MDSSGSCIKDGSLGGRGAGGRGQEDLIKKITAIAQMGDIESLS